MNHNNLDKLKKINILFSVVGLTLILSIIIFRVDYSSPLYSKLTYGGVWFLALSLVIWAIVFGYEFKKIYKKDKKIAILILVFILGSITFRAYLK
ncbi:hypothetical protein SAMN00017477_1955 [Peptoniphilus asaccharolyticus DSM 20463]|uniref:Uncharacterized protein n=1 Tax=Peptoniphilus asaccharolyticus DSM 20463 TaxID=573058 RepID=A0A1W1VHF6_PEPAS|nr:hypothetical protein [Peptoniphilus asaccharolyticus]MBL7574280.1 hypothetical protein [Peptoniphilus asaccharolyticus]SMB92683.1 hypothetical protein SAMN00017477_1955 [Peptoniphilus asaccharolyticus DSM 20463]